MSGNPGCIASPESFSDWYRARADHAVIPSSLLLFDDGSGGFVNRLGPNDERGVDVNGLELDDFVPDAGSHNFLFTTEVAYWFGFEPGFAAELAFLGDDDMWVFVNGRLAGGVYAVKVFHAERNPTARPSS